MQPLATNHILLHIPQSQKVILRSKKIGSTYSTHYELGTVQNMETRCGIIIICELGPCCTNIFSMLPNETFSHESNLLQSKPFRASRLSRTRNYPTVNVIT